MGGDGSRDVLARYQELAKDLGEKYGPRSQAIVFVRYEELIAARSMLLGRPGDVVLRNHVTQLSRHIQDLYSMSEPDRVPTPWRRVTENGPPVIEYDRKHFEERYARVVDRVRDQVITVRDGRLFPPLTARTAYMFVITDEGDLRIWSRPFALTDLVFGRNRSTVGDVPVAHPMLVPERLRVTAAGEIVVLGTDHVRAVIANTKSGHFRPPPSAGDVVRARCRSLFGLADSDIDVFTLFGDAVAA